ncbi:hypothetical protein N657DRAFT_195473 [Parathielavia appendiculata]|uniref:Uncharacterized protein n=1 Tax=Parathielavia appendiculata TaxID=2587402 RepID=A0AAN6Z654_9PEZI|nr:hypothetical protein N657DRAFT_195473 [Parathielavia appendiculata]
MVLPHLPLSLLSAFECPVADTPASTPVFDHSNARTHPRATQSTRNRTLRLPMGGMSSFVSWPMADLSQWNYLDRQRAPRRRHRPRAPCIRPFLCEILAVEKYIDPVLAYFNLLYLAVEQHQQHSALLSFINHPT